MNPLLPLVVIPSFMKNGAHLEALQDTIASIKRTAPLECDILVVDDHSPEQGLVDQLEYWKRLTLTDFEVVRKRENSGFSRTVNYGLRQAAKENRDAILVNADIEMDTPGWVETCRKQEDSNGDPAGLVGALLIYPQSGLIQHAGIYFSFLTRRFYERYKYGPANLPEALRPGVMPCTGAFQYIRADLLTSVGLYDERFRLGYEDVDYSIRVFKAGRECVYCPEVRAYHHESMIRGEKNEQIKRWEMESWHAFVQKWADEGFAQYVPAIL